MSKAGFYVVRLGSDSRPATTEDIEEVRKQLEKLRPGVDFLVTHHDFDIHWVEAKTNFTMTRNDNRSFSCDGFDCCCPEWVEP